MRGIRPKVAGFTILCVCTGNVCRSPAAEQILTAALGREVSVGSAGTHALIGQPIASPMHALLDPTCRRAAGFVARQLSAELISEADLIMAMAREHRRQVVELSPAAVRRTFTLNELARLLSGATAWRNPAQDPAGPAERLARLTAWASAHREPPEHAADDDVVDPYGRDAATYRRSFDQLESGIGVILRALGLRPDE